MKIVTLSDTHNVHNQITVPEGDVLVHCGDHSGAGNLNEYMAFIEWFAQQPHQHKIFIAGNHDGALSDQKPHCATALQLLQDKIETNLYYLENESVEIDGVKFHGFPYTPTFYDWWFMLDPGEMFEEVKKIPKDTDVLLSHGPVHNILDFCGVSTGSLELRDRVFDVKPKYMIFGHIHEDYGLSEVNDTIFINTSICDARYIPSNKPFVINYETGIITD